MNVIARLEYELAYYDPAVHRFNHYITRTPPGLWNLVSIFAAWVSSGRVYSVNDLCFKFYLIAAHLKSHLRRYNWLVEFYGISTIVGYLMPNPVFTYILNIWFINTFCRDTQLNEPGSDNNKQVLCIPQSSIITEASLSDCLMSYPGHSLGECYPSAEMQLGYSTAPTEQTEDTV